MHVTILLLVFVDECIRPGNEPIEQVLISFFSCFIQEACRSNLVGKFLAVSKQSLKDFNRSVVLSFEIFEPIAIKIVMWLRVVSAVVVYVAAEDNLSFVLIEENNFRCKWSVLPRPRFAILGYNACAGTSG